MFQCHLAEYHLPSLLINKDLQYQQRRTFQIYHVTLLKIIKIHHKLHRWRQQQQQQLKYHRYLSQQLEIFLPFITLHQFQDEVGRLQHAHLLDELYRIRRIKALHHPLNVETTPQAISTFITTM